MLRKEKTEKICKLGDHASPDSATQKISRQLHLLLNGHDENCV